MSMTQNEKVSLKNMLDTCHSKFGSFNHSDIIVNSACDSCTGSCKGHGMSVWTACDVK